jgi:hypothetical protein
VTITELPTTTTERLLAVADLIESHPTNYYQEVWWEDNDARPATVLGRGYQCDTVACIAGWAVALTPADWNYAGWEWTDAGSCSLGISVGLADRLFYGNFEAPVAEVVDILRRLAKLPEGERTTTGCLSVLTAGQLSLLFGMRVSTVEYPDEADDPIELPEVDDDDDDEDDDYEQQDLLVGVG